jgi:hypothetical protein
VSLLPIRRSINHSAERNNTKRKDALVCQEKRDEDSHVRKTVRLVGDNYTNLFKLYTIHIAKRLYKQTLEKQASSSKQAVSIIGSLWGFAAAGGGSFAQQSALVCHRVGSSSATNATTTSNTTKVHTNYKAAVPSLRVSWVRISPVQGSSGDETTRLARHVLIITNGCLFNVQ